MKINDIINESGTGALAVSTADALPDTQVFPKLTNSDSYEQYRFGLALASAKAVASGEVEYDKDSVFGEKMVIVARSAEEEEIIRLAKKLYGADSESKHVSSTKSEEAPDINKTSPISTPKKNKYGV